MKIVKGTETDIFSLFPKSVIEVCQDNDSWLKARSTIVGASEVGALLGLNPYDSPLALYERKKKALSIPDNEFMRTGRAVEGAILSLVGEDIKAEVHRPQNIIFKSTDFNMLGATLDGYAVIHDFVDPERVDEGIVTTVEAKNATRGEMWGESGTDEVPADYFAQVQAQLYVTKAPAAILGALVMGKYRRYHIKPDFEAQGRIIDAVGEFQERLKKDLPPDPTSYDEAVNTWGPIIDKKKSLNLTADGKMLYLKMKESQGLIKNLQTEVDGYKLQFLEAMKEADAGSLLVDGKKVLYIVTVKDGEDLDKKALMAEIDPAVWQKFMVTKKGYSYLK